jgi:hypothetical protein
MQKGNPKPQPSGNQPPPRPPKHTAIAANPEDDNSDSRKKGAKNETMRIHLPPKPASSVKINLPAVLPFAGIKSMKKSDGPAIGLPTNARSRRFTHNIELGMVLAAVVALNGMLYILCRL